MKKILYTICLTIVLGSCQSKEEKIAKEFKPLILNYYTQLAKGEDVNIDSVIILKVDTLTELVDSNDTFWRLNLKRGSNQSQIKKIQQDIDGHIKMMRLTSGLSSNLYQNSKDDFDRDMKEMDAMMKINSGILTRMRNINKKLEEKTYDSLSFKGYTVLFNLKAHDSKNVAKDVDSLQLFFDKDRRIKEKAEFK